MRFMARSLFGMVILALTLGLLGMAVGRMQASLAERDARDAGQRPPREREFSVTVDTVQLTRAEPVITAFGEVQSWRALELRAAASGTLVEIADGFRDGGQVAAGDVLFRIDPVEAQSDLALARTQVKEAQAELLEAQAALALAQSDLEAAGSQKTLRQAALTRQIGLRERGVGSDAAVETAELALSSARQTELTRQQGVAEAQARILRAEIGVERQQLALEESERRVSDTEMAAPFDGVLSDVTAVIGRQIQSNEQIGTLIDPAALEVAFRVSNAQFARLVDSTGRVVARDITATLDLEGAPISVSGQIDRAGAEVGEGQTGRLLYARLTGDSARTLRPGDFLRVEIAEPPINGVAVVPATAVASDGTMLLLDGERLEAVEAAILRRQADSLIVMGVPEGRDYVTRIGPQLGPGVKVKASRLGGGIEVQEMVTLDADRQAALIAAIEGNTRMPAAAKTRILDRLRSGEVPVDMLARLESRMGGGGNNGNGNDGGGSGAGQGDRPAATGATMVALDTDRQAALIAALEGNASIPADRKTAMIDRIKSGEAPAGMIARIEAGMAEASSASSEADAHSDAAVELTEDRRARLIALVERNSRMPAEAKARVLSQLQEARVPADLVARLESRAGG